MFGKIIGRVLTLFPAVGAFSLSAASPNSDPEHRLEQVVVTGQHQPTSLRNSVYKVKVITREEIFAKGANDLPSVLNTELGVRLTHDLSLGETDLELFGMGGDNIRVMIDGIPVVERGSNRQSLGQIDIESVERIEIVEGPMSVMYGSDALAGVVNVITRRPVPEEMNNRWSISAVFREESVGGEYDLFHDKGFHKQSLRAGWSGKSGLFLEGGYSRGRHGGWTGDKTGREKQWQPKDQDLYHVSIGFDRGKINARYRLDYLDEEIRNPGNGLQNDPQVVSDKNFRTTRLNHTGHLEWRPRAGLRSVTTLSVQDYERTTRSWFTDEETGKQWLSLEEASQDTSRVMLFFARTSFAWDLTPTLSVLPGVEYRRQKGKGGRLAGDPEESEGSVFLSAEWRPEPRIGVMPGIRAVLLSDYDAPAVIPAVQFKYLFRNEMTVRFSYAYGFRAPTLQERYFSFHNANHNIDGNPDLAAEYSHNFQLHYGWEVFRTGSFSWNASLTGFFNDFRDRITLATDRNDPSHMTYYNVARYKTHGFLWENRITYGRFRAAAGFSLTGRYNDTRNEESVTEKAGADFRYSPEATFSAGYRLGNSGTEFSVFYKFTGKRTEYLYDIYTSEVYKGGTAGYHWADFTVSRSLGDYVRVQGGVKNLFDVRTVENTVRDDPHTSVGGASLIGCGRSFFLGLNVYFNR